MTRNILIAMLLAAGAVQAEEKAALPVELPDVMVTATRSEKEAAALPFTTCLVSAEVMQMEKLSRTSPEALREIPSVMVQKTGHGQGSPFIRGFTGFHTLFLIDGIRLNNSTFRDGPNQYWNTVDPFCIESMEIVKGPGSVLYGSDAVGGTVNALTRSVFDDEADRAVSGRAYYRYSTAEDSHTVRAEGRGTAGGKAGLRAGATVRDFGDLRSGGGDQPKTGYDEVDFDIRAEYLINPNLRLSAAHQTVEQDDAWRTHKTIYGESFHGTTVGDEKKRVLDQERHLSYIAFDAADLSGFIRDLNLTVSHQRQEEDQFRIKKDDTSDIQGYDVDTFGVSLQAISPTKAGEWTYGAEYYRDSVDSYLKKFKADGSLKSIGIQGPVGDDA
ncbi:MAG TPA: TonB-dependent receptor plug domain-containing protein, partial [Kiritimatiellia bacterium]|nr:TonB-dependent receptor plug domain-containing protein [Kiritimatiellia bacterium]